jgi:hypothetical protein
MERVGSASVARTAVSWLPVHGGAPKADAPSLAQGRAIAGRADLIARSIVVRGTLGTTAPPLPKLTHSEASSRFNASIRAGLALITHAPHSAPRTRIQNAAAAASCAASTGLGKTIVVGD